MNAAFGADEEFGSGAGGAGAAKTNPLTASNTMSSRNCLKLFMCGRRRVAGGDAILPVIIICDRLRRHLSQNMMTGSIDREFGTWKRKKPEQIVSKKMAVRSGMLW